MKKSNKGDNVPYPIIKTENAKRVLLVNPPFYRLLGSRYNANSLGIAYIAAVLNKAGHDAYLYNADYKPEREFSNLKSLFESNKSYLDFFEDPQAPIWDEVTKKIVDFNPDWVGYTCYTANLTSIKIISTRVKESIPEVRQVVGGPHSTMDDEILTKLPDIDFSVKREGEFAMLELVEGKNPTNILGVQSRTKFPGIYHNNGDYPPITPVEQLPFPERSKFWGISDEERRFVDVSYVVTIRGCPYRCNYCASPDVWKRNKTQYREPSDVIAELKHLKNNYWNQVKEFDYSQSNNISSKSKLLVEDNTIVYFVDDVFTIDKDRVKVILEAMIVEELNMPFKAEMRTDHLNEEICQLLKRAGCVRAKIGIESGSPRILKQIQKDETREEIIEGCRLLRDAGVPFTVYLMAGFPGETDDDLRMTIDLAKTIEADYYSLGVLSPYFGTKIYKDLIAEGVRLDQTPEHYFYHSSPELLVNTEITDSVLKEYLSLNDFRGTTYI